MLFSVVKVTLTLIFVTKTASTGLGQEQSILTQPAYYDCGSWIYYESLIQKMLYEEEIDILESAVPFIELLYDLEPDYYRINIPENLSTPKSKYRLRPGSNFYVIIGQKKQIVDVVAEMKNGHYIKCKRVDESVPEPSNIGQNEYGYECGHELFSHETIQMSAALARSNKSRNKLFLNPYHGPLYWPGLNYLIYPVSREKNQHFSGKRPENVYFVVISPAGELIDVIAELMHGDFVKCIRTTKVPPDIDSDKDSRHGYSCGLEFFEINHMKRTAKLAKARNSHKGRLTYPKKYYDDSFEGYMYPLLPNGRFYGTVSRTMKHFIIMNLDFEIKFAGIKTPEGITPCEASMRRIEAVSPETDDFICEHFNVEFKNKRLLKLVETACRALGTGNRRYPANYNGPAFGVPGPYVTWPIRDGDNVMGPPSNFRVVMNTECILAGVIAKCNNIFYKCRRSKDNSIPGGKSEMPITETHLLKDRRQTPRKKAPSINAEKQN